MLWPEHVRIVVEPVLNQVTCVSWSAVLLEDHLDHLQFDDELIEMVTEGGRGHFPLGPLPLDHMR